MFGFQELPRFPHAIPRRTATRTVLALGAVLASTIALAGAAQAQDCVGGYRMLKGEIPVMCQGGPAQPMFHASPMNPNEPLHTGSINRTELPADATRPSESPAAAASMNSEADCVNGMRWVYTANSGVSLMMKCS